MDETTAVGAIGRAMIETRVLEFTYRSVEGKESCRRVEPYEVKRNGDGDEELFAIDIDKELNGQKGVLRRFRLSGMRDWDLGDEFRPRQPIRIP